MKKIVPVYPWPMHPKVAEVLQAVPNITLVQAVPGGPGPVLAIRKAPPFVCDAIVVLNPEKVAQAVDVVIANGLEMVTVRDMVSAVVGKKLPHEKLERVESKVRFQ